MSDSNRPANALVRTSGAAMIVAIGVHFVLNMVLKQFPPEGPTPAELDTYLAAEAGTWAIIHGFRYFAFTGILLFAAGLFVRVARNHGPNALAWGVFGLLGTAVFVTNGVVTNGIEMLAFMNHELMRSNHDLFWLLYRTTRVLFTAEVVTWSLLIFGFSAAAWAASRLPKWMSGLGFVNAIAGLLAGGFVVSAFNGGQALWLVDVATLTGLLWFLCVGVYLVAVGDR